LGLGWLLTGRARTTTARLERCRVVARRGAPNEGHPFGWVPPGSLAATVTSSALDDPHLIDTLFVVQDNALWVAGCRRLPPGRRFAVRFGRRAVVLPP
jgi:hypothetical protein